MPEYFTGRTAKSFDLERHKAILFWDFSTDASETVKKQVEWILGHIVKNVENREERRKQYLLALKFSFQYAEEAKIIDILLIEMVQEQEYSVGLISKTGKICSSPGKFIDFCTRVLFLAEKELAWHVRAAFQEYTKYLFQITGQSVSAIRTQQAYVCELLRYLEEKNMPVSDMNAKTVVRYLDHLRMQKLKPQSCNNKIQGTIKSIASLQVKDWICHFEIPVTHFLKKSYPARNKIKGLDERIARASE